MKILVLGSSGFIGAQVVKVLTGKHEVWGASLTPAGDRQLKIDLTQKADIKAALHKLKPGVIINCAGVVENSPKAKLNAKFTDNLLSSVCETDLSVKQVIISGSAAEYGFVSNDAVPVSEDAPLNADSDYGLSKLKESQTALKYKQEKQLPVVVARIFNPIGVGMHHKFLVPGILRQIESIKAGGVPRIEVSRKDSKRDYIAVSDIARAYEALLENTPACNVYNVGSGITTTNAELIELLIMYSGLKKRPEIVETQSVPERPVAARADISRISSELGWRPEISIAEAIKEIINDTRRS